MATTKKTIKNSATKAKATKPAKSAPARSSAASGKKPAKPVKAAAKPATKKAVAAKPKTPAAKKVANKATGKAVSKAVTAAKQAPKKPVKGAAAPGKSAAKGKAVAKPAVAPKAPAKKVSVTSRKTESKVATPEKKATKTATKVAAKVAPVKVPPSKVAATKTPASGEHQILSVKQTTDAAALAAIDTSGYVLPAVKVPGRRGRKPRDFQPESDEIAQLNAVERAEQIKAVDKAKARDRKNREKQFLKDAFAADSEASEEELERRRQKLKTLIKLGKDRGFLTHSEINDHLPENIIDPEAIEGIIGT